MPIFTLTTNVASDKIPADFVKATSALLAQILGKPEAYILVVVQADQKHTSFAGSTTEPGGFGELQAIGIIDAASNKKYQAALAEHLEAQLGIIPERLVILYKPLEGQNVGHGKSTIQ